MKSLASLVAAVLLLAACSTSKPPRAPFTTDGARARQIDARVVAVGYPKQDSIEQLTKRLIAGLDDERERLYAIHRWTSRHIEYDVEGYLSGQRRASHGAVETYQTGKALCDGYAELVVAMGKVAGFEIRKVTGYAKGFGQLLATASPEKENHAWNAVKLGGRWHLLDATWDAGGVDDATRRFVRRPEGPPAYFLASPAAFITTHFPADRQWQLLEQPVAFSSFLGKVAQRPDLARWGLDISRHADERITAAAAPYVFDFGSDKRMQAALSRPAGVPDQPWSLQVRTPEGSRLLLAAPEAGEYKVAIYVAENPTDMQLQPALNYQVRFDSSSRYENGFPQTYGGYYARKVELVSPLDGRLEAGKPVPFKLRSQGSRQMTVFQGNEVVSELKEQDGYFVGLVELPPGRIDLAVIHEGESDYAGILTYQAVGP